MKILRLVYWVLVLMSFSCSVYGDMGFFSSERRVLLELKNSISDPHGLLSSWRANKKPNHCSWSGVSCNSDSRVSGLNISGGNFAHSASCSYKFSGFALHGFGIERNCTSVMKKGEKLVGKLSSFSIEKLTELRVLSLPFNGFSGELPGGLWSLKNLQVIDLEGNSVSGNLSLFDFSGLKNLTVLNLGFNRFFGEIPSSLSKCRGLQVLSLAGNRVTGLIPGFVGGFHELKGLYLSSNRLGGSVPDESWKNCQGLEHLDLSGNFLKGEIPRNLGNCSRLRTMLLFSNAIDGVIPPELGNLKQLEVLDISGNKLLGPIAPTLGNCVNLSVLVFSSQFHGVLEHNSFQGSIPSEITMLPNLKLVWAPFANFQGKFPSNWGSCDKLEMVNLAGNHFNGEISDVFGSCQNLRFLNLSSNRIKGQLDEKLQVPCLTLFDVSRNLMSGLIPRFSDNLCPSIFPSNSDSFHPFDPSNIYLSFFAHKTRLVSHLPLTPFIPAMIHDFSQNNFTGSVPFLPIAPDRVGRKIDYAFLAGDNQLSGLFHKDQFVGDNGLKLNGLFINVSNNVISGQIPSSIGEMWTSLKFLDVSYNQISGEIPESFVKLKMLVILLLNDNKLSGEIPMGFEAMRSLIKYDFSSNNLSGENPTFGPHRVAILSVPPSSNQQDGIGSKTSQNSGTSKKGFNSFEIAIIISASALVVVLLALVAVFLYIKKWKPNPRVETSISQPSDRSGGKLVIFNDVGVELTFGSVVQATGNFTSGKCIGSGGFGATYRAELSPGTTVAVKRLTIEMCQGIPQFNAEIRTLGRIKHPNLVTLIGYYASTSEMFLIYNFLSGGNLEKFIEERAIRLVSLKTLHKIALHVASALAYLHEQCNPRILHRDVKPSNILLDNEFNAYLSDFGLSRLLEGFETHVTTGVAGTFGYVAPEYALTCRVSDKADVYSYGVMLLELISDKRALDPSFSSHENGFTIVTWAVMLLRDGQMMKVFAAGLWDAGPENVLVETLQLAIACTREACSARPTMKQVVRRLKQLQVFLEQ